MDYYDKNIYMSNELYVNSMSNFLKKADIVLCINNKGVAEIIFLILGTIII